MTPNKHRHATGTSSPDSTLPRVVLGGVALFLLLGTILTGYAFALTFSTPPEGARPADSPDSNAPGRPEDWRATLENLRELVATPPTQGGGGTPVEARPAPPSPQVQAAIDGGVAWLKDAVLGKVPSEVRFRVGAQA